MQRQNAVSGVIELKSLGLLQAVEELAKWDLLSWLSADSDLHNAAHTHVQYVQVISLHEGDAIRSVCNYSQENMKFSTCRSIIINRNCC